MKDDVDADFLLRLSVFEDDLADTIFSHPSLSAFTHQWTALMDDLASAIDANTLSISTISTAYTLADKVSAVIQDLANLDMLSTQLTSSLAGEKSELSTSTVDARITTPLKPTQYRSKTPDKPSSPLYIEPSHRWLMENIHDPYPSIPVREGISQKTRCSRKDIDNWFVDARKRIGWNVLRKASFSNKRVEIIDAATRFFVQDDPLRPIDPIVEQEFVAMERRAKDLYHERFVPTDWAAKFDIAVNDWTPETDERSQKQLRTEAQIAAISSYPSPEHSPARSPELIRLTASADVDEAGRSMPLSTSTRKRRSPSVDTPQTDKPNKRFR